MKRLKVKGTKVIIYKLAMVGHIHQFRGSLGPYSF